MSSKRLRSAIHSIAHHAVSGLSFVHPHLGEQAKAAGRRDGSIDLLRGDVLTRGLKISKPLSRASTALSRRFAEILASERIDPATLKSAEIEFQFQSSRYPVSCYVRVETDEGCIFEDAVSAGSGRRAEILD